MNRAPGRWPSAYELRVDGHLDPAWSARLGGLELSHGRDGTTTLKGAVADQAELHGILARIRDLGVTLISVAPLDRVLRSMTTVPDGAGRRRPRC